MKDVATRRLMQRGIPHSTVTCTVTTKPAGNPGRDPQRKGEEHDRCRWSRWLRALQGGSPTSRARGSLAQVPLVAVSAYEPPLGTPKGGFPVAALHTADEERATAESTLRDTVSEELGDQAGQTDLRVSAGLAGRVIVETAHQTNAQLIVLAASPGKSLLPGRSASTSFSKLSAPSCSSRVTAPASSESHHETAR